MVLTRIQRILIAGLGFLGICIIGPAGAQGPSPIAYVVVRYDTGVSIDSLTLELLPKRRHSSRVSVPEVVPVMDTNDDGMSTLRGIEPPAEKVVVTWMVPPVTLPSASA